MVLRVLTVCTANVCRSPMAAALLQRHCDQRSVDAVVRSAGTHAGLVDGDPVAVEAMAERSIDLSGHVPRLVDRGIVASDGADLIVTMARSHLRTVAVMGRGVFQRSFTARELARRSVDAARGLETPLGDLRSLLAVLGDGRAARDLMGDDPVDDLDDPYGLPLAAHRRTVDELDSLTATVAGLLSGEPPDPFDGPQLASR